MSEQIRETAAFAGEGFDAFPSLYADNKLVGEFSAWDRDVLDQRIRDYERFLQKDDLMPRARSEAERIVGHLVFEVMYREGAFNG